LSLLFCVADARGYLVKEKRKRERLILTPSSARADLFGERTVSIWLTLAVSCRRTMRSRAAPVDTASRRRAARRHYEHDP
jgi:hypothetical protein